MSARGKYRGRTWLRSHLPGSLAWVAPKGSRDCGHHAWYRSHDDVWHCYHCRIGEHHGWPWPDDERVVDLGALNRREAREMLDALLASEAAHGKDPAREDLIAQLSLWLEGRPVRESAAR